jgi:glycosyltransferase involved in cell wall biosynthesis
VQSVLAQSHRPVEIIVVVDGRDDATVRALRSMNERTLRVLVPDRNLGNASARNFGVSHATGEWAAFLDDDDLWMPDKLQVQLEAARRAPHRWPIVACRVIARTGKVDLIWPRRYPRAGEPMCDYLCRRSLPVSGEGLVQTSMIVAPKALLTRVTFTDGLRRHVDPDWLLRAVREPNVGVVFPDTREPLAIWNIEQGRTRVSTSGDWRISLTWGQSQRELFTREAYAGFVCKTVSAAAAAAREPHAFGQLWREARRHGRPSWVDLASHLMNFSLTPERRDTFWRLIRRPFGRYRSDRSN